MINHCIEKGGNKLAQTFGSLRDALQNPVTGFDRKSFGPIFRRKSYICRFLGWTLLAILSKPLTSFYHRNLQGLDIVTLTLMSPCARKTGEEERRTIAQSKITAATVRLSVLNNSFSFLFIILV